MSKKKNIGLALSGGAALGSAHVGVLKALEEFEIKPDYISGTSVGSLIAVLYAFGHSIEEITEYAKDMSWLDISEFSFSSMGIFSNEKLGKRIAEIIGRRKLENSDIPVAVVATDLIGGKKIVIKSGDAASAINASSCIPGIYVPIESGDKLLVDGGLAEFVPVSTLPDMGADFIIASDLIAKRSYSKPDNIIQLIVNALDIAIDNYRVTKEKADIWFMPDLSDFSPVDTSRTEELIEIGYEEAKAVLKKHT